MSHEPRRGGAETALVLVRYVTIIRPWSVADRYTFGFDSSDAEQMRVLG